MAWLVLNPVRLRLTLGLARVWNIIVEETEVIKMNLKLKKKKLEISKEVRHNNFKFKKRGKFVNADLVEMKGRIRACSTGFGKKKE